LVAQGSSVAGAVGWHTKKGARDIDLDDLQIGVRADVGTERRAIAPGIQLRKSIFSFESLLHHRDAHQARTCFHGEAGLHGSGILRRVVAAATGLNLPDASAIDAHFNHTACSPASGARYLDLDDVFAVIREIVADRNATAGSERQVLTRPVILKIKLRNFVGGGPQTQRFVTDRETADLVGRSHVAVEQVRRNLKDLGDVVEPKRCVVAGQHGRSIHIQRQ